MSTPILGGTTVPAVVVPSTGRLRPLPFTDIRITEGFWADKQELNSSAILPHCASWMERLGWTANFDRAATATISDGHRGREFADSEIYKLIEAMSWESARHPDGDSADKVALLIDRVAAAQDDDGYLGTLFGRPGQRARYTDFEWGHELYCFGHFIQAAVARARTSDDPQLLKMAIRLANHVCDTFGPGGREKVCGHAIIETALVELYRVTGDRRYLDQAAVFIERRGQGTLAKIEFGRAFYQDDVPVRDADVLRGHAVRALYLAAGAADVAVETRDAELLSALIQQWDNTVAARTYLTGGMGSHHMDEAFGDDYVLPPDRSYCETCAGVASIMFSWRLLLATGDRRYADLIERTLFNIVATSPSREGTAFFYANTLHQRTPGGAAPMNDDGVCIRGGSSGRQAWFEVSCCPPNVARTLASLSGYFATTDDTGLQIHQYSSMHIHTAFGESRPLTVAVECDYPRDGRITVRVIDCDDAPLTLTLRVPPWANGSMLTVGGATGPVEPGVVSIERVFRPGDELVLDMPLTPRFTAPAAQIDAVRGCVAVERGPEVLCLESPDVPTVSTVDAIRVDPLIAPRHVGDRTVVTGRVIGLSRPEWPYAEAADPAENRELVDIPLIAYRDWANRGPSSMRIWIPVIPRVAVDATPAGQPL